MTKKNFKLKKTQDLSRKRTIAKFGMAVSMGTLVATGLIDSKKARKLHLVSGASLIGFSAWHYSLYPSKKKKV